MSKIKDIIAVIEKFAPLNLQIEGDNSGQIYGDINNEVSGVLVTLDATPEVIREARTNNCNLIITHHPTIFHPINKIDTQLSTHKALVMAIKHDIAIYACHTNCDFTINGLNDCLAKKLGARNIRPIKEGDLASGRIGELDRQFTLAEYASVVAQATKDPRITTVGDVNQPISTIAVINGAGGGSENALICAKNSGADIFITSELKYNVLRLAKDINYAIICLGHYDSEIMFMDLIVSLLNNNGYINNVIASNKCANPYN